MKINIPAPCSENWAAMQPNEKGRYCGSCCKTVIDFTGMSPQAIAAFLTEHASQKICGRFTEQQLAAEYDADLHIATMHLLHSGWPVIKKIAAVFILLFALSRNSNAQKTINTLQPVATTAGVRTLAKTDLSLAVTDTIPVATSAECLAGISGGLKVTATRSAKRKWKKTQKKERQLQRRQEKESALSGEVVITGMVIPD